MLKTISKAAFRVGAALGLALSGFSAAAQQFSGDLVRTDARATTTRPVGKINVFQDKVRLETSDVPGGFFLVLGDSGTAYFVRPAQKIFMDARQSSHLIQMFVVVGLDDPCTRWRAMAMIAGAANETTEWRCERISDDIVNGRRVIKYWGISPANRKYLVWIDPQLHFPVRLRYEDGTILDLVDIQDALEPESLFVVPADYRKFEPQRLIDRIKQSDVWVEAAH
jgi:hypothetical protein